MASTDRATTLRSELTPEAMSALAPHEVAREVARIEAAAVSDLAQRFGPAFDGAVELLAALRGRLVVSGAGKSGLVGARVAATLSATGTPASFLHPADALHGDLGLLRPEDAVLLISKSGDTGELRQLTPLLKRVGVPILLITGDPDSALGRQADVVLDLGRPREACPYGIAPTSSATAAGVIGDALAIALLLRRGVTPRDLAFLHPGGVIGRAVTMQVSEVMHRGESLPRVLDSARLRDALSEIVSKRLGMTTVVDAKGTLVGVVTDGDFKRVLVRDPNPLDLAVTAVMSTRPRIIDGGALLAEAVRCMEENDPSPITSLVVVDAENRPLGVVHLHDCLRPRT
jgi:arabinose-5-phosphate isomerase